MANIQASFLNDDLDLSGFIFAQTSTGGIYSRTTIIPRFGTVIDTFQYVLNASGNIVSVSALIFPDGPWSITEINIPQVLLLANITNVVPLLINGDDLVNGTSQYNFLKSGNGNDKIFAGAGDDYAYGGNGNDFIYGDAGNDYISGEIGNDRLFGGDGDDALNGGAGNDILRGDAGADVIDGGLGVDRADYMNSNAAVTVNLTASTGLGGHAAGDVLSNVENLYGSTFGDVLIGSAVANTLYGNGGNDQLFGLAGNDRLEGQVGDDALFGGDGNDIAGGGDGNDGVFGEIGNDTLYGGNGNDYLAGGEGNDVIWGDAGNDQIDAGAGNDFVVLGLGNDGFTLGGGNDRVRFDYGNGNDTIFDFGNGSDVIDFTATDMTLAALQANAIDTNSGVLLQVGSGTILLAGLALYQLEWNYDFAFTA